jgi:alpha-tubulin suppressor-like RCC1 family protein
MAFPSLRRSELRPTHLHAALVCAALSFGCSEVRILDHEPDDPCRAGGCTEPPEPEPEPCHDGTVCDDGDACTTEDVCTNGTCGGTAVTCEPRAPECVDYETRRTYERTGCAAGDCTYDAFDETCPNGCADGTCNLVKPMITAGYMHVCALSGAGKVRCWGANGSGQLGYGHTEHIGDDELPSSAGDVDVGGVVTEVRAGIYHTCALLQTGSVRCWGDRGGMFSYPGDFVIGDDETPASVGDVEVGGPVKQIAVGSHHNCVLLETGTVRCWGFNSGELGYGHSENIGDDESVASAGEVDMGGVVSRISAGDSATCALLTTGGLRCFGWNVHGRLGYGHTENLGDDETPAAFGDVPIGADVLQVAAETGHHLGHVCALVEGGGVRCWGEAFWDATGYGTTNDVGDDETPASVGDVPIGAPVKRVATGGTHTCALLERGALRCWGNGAAGQLGGGSKLQDVPVAGDIDMVACGGGNTCVLMKDGGVRCWGDNQVGELGYGHTDFIYDASTAGEISTW